MLHCSIIICHTSLIVAVSNNWRCLSSSIWNAFFKWIISSTCSSCLTSQPIMCRIVYKISTYKSSSCKWSSLLSSFRFSHRDVIHSENVKHGVQLIEYSIILFKATCITYRQHFTFIFRQRQSRRVSPSETGRRCNRRHRRCQNCMWSISIWQPIPTRCWITILQINDIIPWTRTRKAVSWAPLERYLFENIDFFSIDICLQRFYVWKRD